MSITPIQATSNVEEQKNLSLSANGAIKRVRSSGLSANGHADYAQSQLKNAMHIAAENGDLDGLLKLLQKNRSLLNALNAEGKTPYQVARDANQVYAAKYLELLVEMPSYLKTSDNAYIKCFSFRITEFRELKQESLNHPI